MSGRHRKPIQTVLTGCRTQPIDPTRREQILGAAHAEWSHSHGEDVLLWRTVARTTTAIAATLLVAFITVAVDERLTDTARRESRIVVAVATPVAEDDAWLGDTLMDWPLYRHMVRVRGRHRTCVLLPYSAERLDKFINSGG